MRNLLLLFVLVSLCLGSLAAQVTTFPWLESFDLESFPPEGWQAIDRDGDELNWGRVLNVPATPFAVTPAMGIGFAASRSWTMGEGSVELPLYPDNWLISPRLAIPSNAAAVTLTYRIRSVITAYMDHYGVFVSTTGTTIADGTGDVVGDFTRLTNETPPASWTTKTIDLSAYSGQSIYLAFRHYDSDDKDHICLDRVQVSLAFPITPNVTTPAWALNLYPNIRILFDESMAHTKTLHLMRKDIIASDTSLLTL